MCPSKATNTLGLIKPKVYLFSTSSHVDTISVNSLDITLFKPDIDFSEYDYFIITSKQVSKVLKQYSTKVLKPALCISKATANSYERLGGKVLEIGSGYGDDLVSTIQKYSKSTKWLYLRAKVIASSFTSKMKDDDYNIDEIIVYESKCSSAIENIELGDNATLIFTSPSSVECFLKTHTMTKNAKVIVIGTTTAKALPKNIKYKIAQNPTIESCIDLVR